MDKKLFVGATLVTATVIGGLVYYRHARRQQAPDEIIQVDIDGVPHNVPMSVLSEVQKKLLSREAWAIREMLLREAEKLEES